MIYYINTIRYTVVYTICCCLDYYQVQVRLLAFPLALGRVFSPLLCSELIQRREEKRREETYAAKKKNEKGQKTNGTTHTNRNYDYDYYDYQKRVRAKVSLMNFVVIVI